MSRLIDVNARVTVLTYDEMTEEYDHVEMSVSEALDFATDEGCPKPIDAIPVEWLKERHRKCCEDADTDLMDAITVLLNEYHVQQKEQEAEHG